jgi:hypothetical protein
MKNLLLKSMRSDVKFGVKDYDYINSPVIERKMTPEDYERINKAKKAEGKRPIGLKYAGR